MGNPSCLLFGRPLFSRPGFRPVVSLSAESQLPLTVPQRALCAGVGSGLVLLLGVACWLEPDSRGFGTHQQLGLPPCTFSSVFGIRCPSCGMTTSWSHTMRGELVSAVKSNVGGLLLALLSVLLGPWLLVSGIRGKWTGWYPNEWVVVVVGGVVLLTTLCDWLWRCL
ncbi:MAG: hypothetical protein CMJ75_21150 [Planctomycetaceae bacterium]|nr:hypothetical protein [Planctomycetaceae bacterium]